MMKKFLTLISVILFSAVSLIAQNGSVEGIVKDNQNNKPLVGANIILKSSSYYATTNNSGKFFMKGIPDGNYTLIVSFVGYQTLEKKLTINSSKTIEVEASLSSTPINLGEVVVTSLKKEKLARDISMPMEVMTKKEFDEIPTVTLADALKKEPGVNLARDGIWLTHVNIRGLSRQNVVTLIDGNRIETATNIAAGMSLIDLDDVERIEVIKGGVSSLYGTGATGGVVNITTTIPAYNDNFNITGSVSSSYNSVNDGSKGNLSLSASQSNWYAKFDGSIRNAGDTQTPEGKLQNSRFRDNNISASAGFRPFVNHELKFEYQRFSAKDVGIPGGDPFPQNAKATYPTEFREMYSTEYKIKNLFPSLMSISVKYFHQLIERRVELIPNPNAIVNTGADHTTDGFQFNTDWYISKNNRLIAGVDFWQREYDGSRTRYIKPKNQYIVDSPVPNSTYQSLGIFAQDEMMFIQDRLNITLGGRYDFINVSNEETNNPNYIIVNGNRNDNPPLIPEASYPANEDNDKSWSANLGLLYNVTNKIDLTLNLARAFRSPTLEERYQYIDLGGTVYLGNPNLEPEKSYSADLGVRYWGNFFSLKANAFYNTFTDLVADQYDLVDSLYKKQNIGEAELYGFEFSTEVNPYKNIVLYATAAFVRGKDTGNNTDLAEIPPLNGVVGVKSSLGDYINFDLNANYADAQTKVTLGERTTPGYVVINLYVNSSPINLGIFELQLFSGAENIFDKAYRNHLATNRGLITLEPGRNVFAKIRLSW